MKKLLGLLICAAMIGATAADHVGQAKCTSSRLPGGSSGLPRTRVDACFSRTSGVRAVPFTFAVLSLFARRSHYAFEKAPLARGEVDTTRISEKTNLVVERIRFWSDVMNEPRFFLALVPKTPPQLGEAFILNHGWFDRPEYLLTYLKVDEVYDSMLARNEVRPAVLIVPDVRFNNFHRLNSGRSPFPPYLTLIAEEVAGVVSQRYKIPLERDRWAIGGFSFGGYLSLDVGRRYPGRFGSVSVISGLVDPHWSFWSENHVTSDAADAVGRSKDSIVVPGPVPRLFLACGTNDRLFATMQRLHRTLDANGIRYSWSYAPGGHTWSYWSSVLKPMIEFSLGTYDR
jgi:enterochelin esterase-like enzyme